MFDFSAEETSVLGEENGGKGGGKKRKRNWMKKILN